MNQLIALLESPKDPSVKDGLDLLAALAALLGPALDEVLRGSARALRSASPVAHGTDPPCSAVVNTSTQAAGVFGAAGAWIHEKWMCALAPAWAGSPWPG